MIEIAVEPEEAARDHDDHQHVGERVQIPADLEAGVQRRDDQQRRAEIDMCRSPALHAAHRRAVAALANAEKREPDDEQRTDRPST